MGKWAVLLLLAGTTAWPAMAAAAKSASIQQFEQMMFAVQGKSDEKVADRLGDVVLTERVSPARLAKWEKQFPGSHTREVLMRLADESAFLEPPVDDVVKDPMPDVETQQRMMTVALDYVKTATRQMPNFLATRGTTHFEDNPTPASESRSLPMSIESAARAIRVPGYTSGRSESKPMHITGTTKMTVTYRDGYEVRDTDLGKAKKEARPTNSLTTSGEFGPILGVVVGDALRSEVTWARWEQGASDPVAVFHYSVPEDRSNYGVGVPSGGKFEDVYPAYHGEIALDPATGAILRLSIVVEMAPPNQMMQTAMLVEYAPVVIGDRTYTCPVHGVAFSKVPVANPKVPQGVVAQANDNNVEILTQLNDVTFTEYHLFGSEARIVGDGGGKSETAPAGAGPQN